MSWVDCKTCGQLRKVMCIVVPSDDGPVWKNPPCHACGAPAWDQPDSADPYDDQPIMSESGRPFGRPMSELPEHFSFPVNARGQRTTLGGPDFAGVQCRCGDQDCAYTVRIADADPALSHEES